MLDLSLVRSVSETTTGSAPPGIAGGGGPSAVIFDPQVVLELETIGGRLSHGEILRAAHIRDQLGALPTSVSRFEEWLR